MIPRRTDMREFVRDSLIAGSVDLAVDTDSCPIISLICSGGNLSVVLAIMVLPPSYDFSYVRLHHKSNLLQALLPNGIPHLG